jgi:hypothetical protein
MAVELFGVGVASRHHRSVLGDAHLGSFCQGKLCLSDTSAELAATCSDGMNKFVKL